MTSIARAGAHVSTLIARTPAVCLPAPPIFPSHSQCSQTLIKLAPPARAAAYADYSVVSDDVEDYDWQADEELDVLEAAEDEDADGREGANAPTTTDPAQQLMSDLVRNRHPQGPWQLASGLDGESALTMALQLVYGGEELKAFLELPGQEDSPKQHIMLTAPQTQTQPLQPTALPHPCLPLAQRLVSEAGAGEVQGSGGHLSHPLAALVSRQGSGWGGEAEGQGRAGAPSEIQTLLPPAYVNTVRMKAIKGKGWGVVATDMLQMGEVVLACEPLALHIGPQPHTAARPLPPATSTSSPPAAATSARPSQGGAASRSSSSSGKRSSSTRTGSSSSSNSSGSNSSSSSSSRMLSQLRGNPEGSKGSGMVVARRGAGAGAAAAAGGRKVHGAQGPREEEEAPAAAPAVAAWAAPQLLTALVDLQLCLAPTSTPRLALATLCFSTTSAPTAAEPGALPPGLIAASSHTSSQHGSGWGGAGSRSSGSWGGGSGGAAHAGGAQQFPGGPGVAGAVRVRGSDQMRELGSWRPQQWHGGDGAGSSSSSSDVDPMWQSLMLPHEVWGEGEGQEEAPELSLEELARVLRFNAITLPSTDPVLARCRKEATQVVTGLWPEAALLNHSCAPNTSACCIGGRLVIRTTASVYSGDELTLNYLGTRGACQPLMARRLQLRQRWGFWCECPRCRREARMEELQPALMQVHELTQELDTRFITLLRNHVRLPPPAPAPPKQQPQTRRRRGAAMKGVQGGGAASEGGQGQGPALLPPYGWLTEAGRESAWQLGEYACSLRDQLHTAFEGSSELESDRTLMVQLLGGVHPLYELIATLRELLSPCSPASLVDLETASVVLEAVLPGCMETVLARARVAHVTRQLYRSTETRAREATQACREAIILRYGSCKQTTLRMLTHHSSALALAAPSAAAAAATGLPLAALEEAGPASYVLPTPAHWQPTQPEYQYKITTNLRQMRTPLEPPKADVGLAPTRPLSPVCLFAPHWLSLVDPRVWEERMAEVLGEQSADEQRSQPAALTAAPPIRREPPITDMEDDRVLSSLLDSAPLALGQLWTPDQSVEDSAPQLTSKASKTALLPRAVVVSEQVIVDDGEDSDDEVEQQPIRSTPSPRGREPRGRKKGVGKQKKKDDWASSWS